MPFVARSFAQDAPRADLLAYIRQLETIVQGLNDEHEEIDDILSQMRSCTDPRCSMCAPCVTALFVKIKPNPLTLPKKYAQSAWRK